MQEFNSPFGKIQAFESNDKFGSSILLIEPGREIKPHRHKKTKEIEVILEGEITCGSKTQKAGEVNVWEINKAHGYKNESGSLVKILCITIPPYDLEDSFDVE